MHFCMDYLYLKLDPEKNPVRLKGIISSLNDCLSKLFMGLMRNCLILVLLFSNFLVQGQTKKVLFIGNSYTLTNNMPQITANIASSAGNQLIFSSSAIPSYSLQQHFLNTGTMGLIRQGGWDYVVLQEHSQYPSEPLSWVESNVYPYARNLDQEINTYNKNVETMFYMTWGRKDGDASRCSRLPQVCTYIGMDNLTSERYMYMAQSNQAVVSPVGAVWRYIRVNYPTIELYDADGSHPSAAGSYAAACCFYTAVFRKDPTLATYNFILDPTVASRIRTAAKQVVFNSLLTWYIGSYDKYTVTVNAGTGGTINPAGTQSVNYGANLTFSIYPGTGYRISDVKADNVSLGAVSSYTFRNITSNRSISATFVPFAGSITASAGAGGEISPKGSIMANYGTNRSFTITPEKDYRIADLIVDNGSVGAVNSYTFYNITSNHTISAFFAKLTYSITSSFGNNGHINPSGTIVATSGANQAFTIEPDKGYQIENVIVDNIPSGIISQFTFIDIKSNHVISATFKPLIYYLTGSAEHGGVIKPSGLVTINYGGDLTYSITPDKGYQIADVLVDNASVGVASNYSFRNVTSGHSISVRFKPITYTITGISGPGGSIRPEGNAKVNYGDDQSYTILPDYGYKMSNLIVDYHPVYITSNEFSFNNVTQNHTIFVTFSKIMTYVIKTGYLKNGSISPAGGTSVFEGSDQSYTLIPAPGYRISKVFIDTTLISPVSEYTFRNISSDHFISATFSSSVEPDIYPNPFKHEFKINIRSPYDYKYEISIINLANKVVYQNREIPANTTITITPEISPGFYILNIYHKGEKAAFVRIVKN